MGRLFWVILPHSGACRVAHSVVSDFATPWTIAHQAPLVEEARIFQARILERLPFPTPGDLPDSGMEPASLSSPVLADGFFTTEPPGKPSVQVGPI